MWEVTVKLNYNGKDYLTNVIVGKDAPQKQIQHMALEQIKKQWSK